VTGSVNLAESCRKWDSKLVICSSDQVYFGSSFPGPHRETESLSPANVYGSQKLRAETLCQAADPDTVCLRLSWMYDTQSHPGEHGHFLTTFRAALEDTTKPLTWPVHDRRGITDVRYVVENLPKTLGLPGGVYNFGSENRESTYDTVKSVLEELDMQTALARLIPNTQAFADSPRDISMNTEKIRATGIFFPSTQEGLLQALKEVCE
jgi:dTDP-4-dehydrorhamnose reductase